MLVLTGVFSWVLIAGLRGSTWDGSTSEQGLGLRHAWVVLGALALLGMALGVSAAVLIAHRLGLADDSGGFFLTWILCFLVGLAPLEVMAATYGQRVT